jgi:molybdenum cofactor guanylyltransferase
MQVSAVILAGGQSRRMGRDKAWVNYCGKPLIQLALEKVRQLGITEVFVSGRQDVDYPLPDCRVLIDLDPGFGPIAGIERALGASTAPLVLVLPVDLPAMTMPFLERLLSICDRFTGVVPSLNGKIEPLVAVYPARCHMYALLNMAAANYAVKDFAAACLHERAIRTLRVAARHTSCFTNCNTPGEMAALEPNGCGKPIIPA